MDTYDPNAAAGMALGMGFLIIWLVFFVGIMLFFGYCYKLMAEKTGNGDKTGVWWIPIVNWLIPIRIAGKPDWWLLLLLIPFVNVIVMIIVMMQVAEARGKESWWGIVAALVSIVGVPYLAFSE